MRKVIDRSCRVEGCSGKFYALQLCRRHNAQFKRTGKVNTVEHALTPRRAIIEGTIAKIPLKNGEYAIVDIDYAYLDKYLWHRTNRYVYRNPDTQTIPGKKIAMHRVIAKPSDDQVVDHINGDGLDNRKANLRVCTFGENLRNRGRSSNNKSGYKGVCWHIQAKKWHAQITVNGKKLKLGFFETAIQAAEAYNKAAKEHHKDFAYTNKLS